MHIVPRPQLSLRMRCFIWDETISFLAAPLNTFTTLVLNDVIRPRTPGPSAALSTRRRLPAAHILCCGTALTNYSTSARAPDVLLSAHTLGLLQTYAAGGRLTALRIRRPATAVLQRRHGVAALAHRAWGNRVSASEGNIFGPT